VSKRTLARRLESENTRYRKIRDQVLLELAQRYLRESRQWVESIAGLLGYYDSAAFRKAFKRWTAMTRREFRRLRH
jgi:AraC-like DNA-binding protein